MFSFASVQIEDCEVEPFEGLSLVQTRINKLTVHNSVHLLKVRAARTGSVEHCYCHRIATVC